MPYKDPDKQREYNAITGPARCRKWRENNKERRSEYKKAYRAKNKEKISFARREYALQSVYGMTQYDYQQLLEEQHGCCAICGTTKPGGNRHSKHFHVDHDHITGMVRGLLCCKCNRALGILGDGVEVIQRALIYLTKRTNNGNPYTI